MNNKEAYFNYAITTDALIFSVDSRESSNTKKLPEKYFSVLLVKRDKEPFVNKWVLPGGFLEKHENTDEANKRVVQKETNLTNLYTKQLYTFSGERDPRGSVISVSYMTLIDKSKIPNTLSENASWFDITTFEKDNEIVINLTNGNETFTIKYNKKLIDAKSNEYEYSSDKKTLGFDHEDILIKGIVALRKEVNETDLIFNLMPDVFTIGELKQVYELILGKKLINSAFRRVIAKKIEPTNESIKTGGHRPSGLYKFKIEK